MGSTEQLTVTTPPKEAPYADASPESTCIPTSDSGSSGSHSPAASSDGQGQSFFGGVTRKLKFEDVDVSSNDLLPKLSILDPYTNLGSEAEGDQEKGHVGIAATGRVVLERPMAQDQTALSGALLEAASGTPNRVYWESFFVVIPVFCGYAALFGLQHEIKVKIGIKDNSSAASHAFGVATSFLYIFNLIMRFAHNIVFGFMGPRGRVFIAMLSMSCSMLVISVPIMMFGYKSMTWVILAYSLGGISVGCFESNLLACLTQFGHQTKRIAICAIPVGISLTLVGGFFLMGPPFRVPSTAIYIAVSALVLCGMAVMKLRIPISTTTCPNDASQNWLAKQALAVKQWRTWLPQFWHYPLAFTLDMFALSAFSPGVALFIYDQKIVTLTSGLAIQTASFFAIFNCFTAAGGIMGRWISYYIKPRHPIFYTIFSATGVVLILSKVPLLAPVGGYCITFGDGLIYGSISRHIDMVVPKQFNLFAISFWLFIGDIGSVVGSNSMSFIRDWVVGH